MQNVAGYTTMRYREHDASNMLRKEETLMAEEQKTLAIMCGGGPAPGLNGVISAAAIESINRGMRVLGIYDGFQWLAQQCKVTDNIQQFVPGRFVTMMQFQVIEYAILHHINPWLLEKVGQTVEFIL